MLTPSRRRWILIAPLLALLVPMPGSAQEIGTVRVATGLSGATYVTAPPGDLERLFILQISGPVRILDLATGVVNPVPFLTVPADTVEEGLQGLAFHPDYTTNGYLYVYFQAAGRSELVRYTRSLADPDLADPASAHPIFSIAQPTRFHNGGWVGFGPDGFLYLPLGDGGPPPNDPNNHGQTIVNDLFSTVLRLDVDGDDFPADTERNYAIPPTNPFVGIAGDDEIWAYGLRNPFRASFDRLTGDFYIADVGENTREEIDFQTAASTGGENYGWRLREGAIATPGGVGGPLPLGGIDPIYDYPHGSGGSEGNSVTGGYVYRGPVIQLRGKYFFGDFVNERIWSIEHDGVAVTEFLDWTTTFLPDVGAINQIVGFGEDGVGNLYIVDWGGEVFQVVGPLAPIPVLSTARWLLIPLLAAAGALLARQARRSVGVVDSPVPSVTE
jgi:hypothetical protein